MKTFIFTIPPQQKIFLEVPRRYKIVDNTDLEFDCPTVFPIFNQINAYAEKDDTITLVPILMGHEDTENTYSKQNYDRFLGEYKITEDQIIIKDRSAKSENEIQAELKEAVSLSNTDNIQYHLENTWRDLNLQVQYRPIHVSHSGSIKTMHELLIKIVETISDGDVIYGEVTYGNKVNSISLYTALIAAHRLRKNTRLESIIYGEFNFKTQTKNLYDITSYAYLDELTHIMADIPYEDPVGALKQKIIIPDFE